jgi:hypothetical protein
VKDHEAHGKPSPRLGPGENKPSSESTVQILLPQIHLVNLEHKIQILFLLRQHLVAVFFDLEKANDTIWRHGILRTLHHWNVRGWLPLFIADFLQEHYFLVHLSSVLSPLHPQESGVPQGSVLSVILFTVAINGIVNAVGWSLG